jgi:2-polyprenyl-3-methyl-5-hydroxy-6-metoxy-1,4-benzoquinol methylase
MESEINLKKVSAQKNYVNWIFKEIKPYLGNNLLEVGAGLGVFTKLLENNKNILPIDKQTYNINYSSKKIRKFDITHNPKKLKKQFDTVVCMNVLEHIKDDALALKNMHQLLLPNGKLILMVPAFRGLYGKIDKANKHYRRYNKKEIIRKLKQANYRIKKIKYLDFIGLFGWLYQNKILNSKIHRTIDLKRFNSLCPLLQKIESIIPPPIGLNLIIIAKK